MKTPLISLLLLFTILMQAQKPSEFFPDPKAKILVVGSFHFAYPNLDAIKTQKSDQLDVLSPETSKEVTELVEYIKKFKPTKIAIEAFPNWQANEKLKKYSEGSYRQERDERYQLAMRIANDLKITELFSVDAESVLDDLSQRFGKKDSLYFINLSRDYDFKSDDKYLNYYNNFYQASGGTKSSSNKSILENLKYSNSPEYHQYEYGSYLTGDFKLREYDGADMLAMLWYSRNLRIFRNIQRIPQTADDRILVIIGNGHASVLRQLITTSPEYDFVEFSSLTKK